VREAALRRVGEGMGFMFGKTIVVGPLQMTVNRLCYDSGAGLDFATIRYGDKGLGLGCRPKL
jgi:hypothetical protein